MPAGPKLIRAGLRGELSLLGGESRHAIIAAMSAQESVREGLETQADETDLARREISQSSRAQSDHSPSSEQLIDDGFVRFRRNHFYAALIPLALVTGLAAGYLLWGRGTNQPAASQGRAAGEAARFDVSADDDPAIGPQDAAVTIIEFSDFNCPYCRQFHQTTFSELLAAYPDQIRFVYRDYPITSQESYLAAQAAECANEQDSFWEYHDALFSGRLGLSPTAYRQYAVDLGLNSDELMRCVESGRFADEVQADARYASGLGINGTPTFFINGIPLVGAQPFSEFERIIEEELE